VVEVMSKLIAGLLMAGLPYEETALARSCHLQIIYNDLILYTCFWTTMVQIRWKLKTIPSTIR